MHDDRPDLTALLNAIRESPDDGHRWLALASWLWDNGRDDEAAAVRVFWPTLRTNVLVSGVPLHETLRQVAGHAARPARSADRAAGSRPSNRRVVSRRPSAGITRGPGSLVGCWRRGGGRGSMDGRVRPSPRSPIVTTTVAAPPGTDRRAAPRFQPALGTVCRLGPAWPRVGLVWNLSATGLSALFGDPPPAGAEISAVLAADGGEAGLGIAIRVVHVREVATGDYLVGARFARPLTGDEMAPFVAPPLAPGRAPPRKG